MIEPTLQQLIADKRVSNRHSLNAWIEVPGFLSFYARFGKRIIHTKDDQQNNKRYIFEECLDVATISAEYPGKGTFTNFWKAFRKENPSIPIYVENALDERFGKYLERNGFKPVLNPMCFILLPEGVDK